MTCTWRTSVITTRLPSGPGGVLPGSIDPAGACRFRAAPAGAASAGQQAEARLVAESEAVRLGGDAAGPQGSGAAWRAVEKAPGVERGDEVRLSAQAVISGPRAIHASSDAEGKVHHALCAQVPSCDVPDFKRKFKIDEEVGDADARVLPVKLQGRLRHRGYGEAVDKLDEVTFEDRGGHLPGPRTALWRAKFLVRRGGPMAHREWWKSVSKLSESDFGVAEHESAARAFQAALEYDQLDVPNLISMEHTMRRAQLVEYYHWERTRQEMTSKSGGVKGPDKEEQLVFMGAHQNQGNLMISPDLVAFTARSWRGRAPSTSRAARRVRSAPCGGNDCLWGGPRDRPTEAWRQQGGAGSGRAARHRGGSGRFLGSTFAVVQGREAAQPQEAAPRGEGRGGGSDAVGARVRLRGRPPHGVARRARRCRGAEVSPPSRGAAGRPAGGNVRPGSL
ncbi:unnamed protein product [Prorocentrum cordatum]|uniref:Uncharacterized protein n=1 Tax=Prorocentrum cordatum TaxID=2364126 RepID=A0ABN9Y898_9DINO|nr:unnamed protein product [Polarella glacialis]